MRVPVPRGSGYTTPVSSPAVVPTGSLLAFAATAFVADRRPRVPACSSSSAGGVALGSPLRRVATVLRHAAGAYTQVVVVALGLGSAHRALGDASSPRSSSSAPTYVVFLGVQAVPAPASGSRSVLDAATAPRGTRRTPREGYVVGDHQPPRPRSSMAAASCPQFADPAEGPRAPPAPRSSASSSVAIALDLGQHSGASPAGSARAWLGRSAAAARGARRARRRSCTIGLGVRLAARRPSSDCVTAFTRQAAPRGRRGRRRRCRAAGVLAAAGPAGPARRTPASFRDWILRRPDAFIPSAPEGVVKLEQWCTPPPAGATSTCSWRRRKATEPGRDSPSALSSTVPQRGRRISSRSGSHGS